MDNLTASQRSYCMSRVKGKNTSIELIVRSALHRAGLRYRLHVKNLPGTPDIVFHAAHVAVFVDGDFWHGWRFPQWEKTLTEPWRKKIAGNRMRDQRNFRKLRRMGWCVIRVWDHEIQTNLKSVVERIRSYVKQGQHGEHCDMV